MLRTAAFTFLAALVATATVHANGDSKAPRPSDKATKRVLCECGHECATTPQAIVLRRTVPGANLDTHHGTPIRDKSGVHYIPRRDSDKSRDLAKAKMDKNKKQIARACDCHDDKNGKKSPAKS